MSHYGAWRRQPSTPPRRAARGVSGQAYCRAQLSKAAQAVCTHLRGNIVRSATESRRGDTVADPLLAHSEICQFTVTLVVQQYVVQFQISERNRE